MNFSIQKNESYTIIRATNQKLDAGMAPELKSAILTVVENGGKNILVDLSKCSLCDSSGLSALLLGNRLCKEVRGNFILFGLSTRIREMMDLIEMESYLKVAENEAAAVGLFV